jgi:hypothetical protein
MLAGCGLAGGRESFFGAKDELRNFGDFSEKLHDK